eukprot:6307653-Pyramimonas_sp.AAC.1
MRVHRSLHVTRLFPGTIQVLMTLHPFTIEMIQFLARLLSVNGYPKQAAAYPVLSILRPYRTPDTYGANHFTAREETSLYLAGMLHAVDF